MTDALKDNNCLTKEKQLEILRSKKPICWHCGKDCINWDSLRNHLEKKHPRGYIILDFRK